MARDFGNYNQLFERFEQDFNIADLTPKNINKFLGVRTEGRLGLAETIAQASLIFKEIAKADNINALKQLKRDAGGLLVKRDEIIGLINNKIESLRVARRERVIAVGFTRVENFAMERGIELSERIVGREEVWRGKKIISIRDSKGRFKAWRRV